VQQIRGVRGPLLDRDPVGAGYGEDRVAPDRRQGQPRPPAATEALCEQIAMLEAQAARRLASDADSGISKSEVSRICADLDTDVGAFRDRTLAGPAFPYVFLDATYCKARVNHRVAS